MKIILLSFDPLYFEQLESGQKKFEYRKRFTNESVLAYIYLTGNIRQIVGKMYLGRRIPLSNFLYRFKDDYVTVRRIKKFISKYQIEYAIPINRIEFIERISIEQLKSNICGFVSPRSYIYVNDTEILKWITTTEKITNTIDFDHDNIECSNICSS